MLLRDFFRIAALPCAALVLVACGEDDGGSGELPDVTIPEDKVDEWEVFHFSELEKPYEEVDACILYQDEEYDDTSTLSTCRCEECLEIMQECDAVPGCPEIRACAQESGCNGEFGCYLIPGAPCTEVIDTWGNAGVATATAVELMDCSMGARCR